ncbi:15689_t:CDS:2, partial [Funneliformis geosporum]
STLGTDDEFETDDRELEMDDSDEFKTDDDVLLYIFEKRTNVHDHIISYPMTLYSLNPNFSQDYLPTFAFLDALFAHHFAKLLQTSMLPPTTIQYG